MDKPEVIKIIKEYLGNASPGEWTGKTIDVSRGGTGKTVFSSGILMASGSAPFKTVSTLPPETISRPISMPAESVVSSNTYGQASYMGTYNNRYANELHTHGTPSEITTLLHSNLTQLAYADAGHTGFSPDTHDHTEYVPYTGATANVNLGVRSLVSESNIQGSQIMSTGGFIRIRTDSGWFNYAQLSFSGDSNQNRTITIPDASGTLALTSDITTHSALTTGVHGLGTMSQQNSNNVSITGGTISCNTVIGTAGVGAGEAIAITQVGTPPLYTGYIMVENITAPRTLQFPNNSGTMALTTDTAPDSDKLDGQHGSYYQTSLGYTPVNKAGDTMTGALGVSMTSPHVRLTDSYDTYYAEFYRASGIAGLRSQTLSVGSTGSALEWKTTTTNLTIGGTLANFVSTSFDICMWIKSTGPAAAHTIMKQVQDQIFYILTGLGGSNNIYFFDAGWNDTGFTLTTSYQFLEVWYDGSKVWVNLNNSGSPYSRTTTISGTVTALSFLTPLFGTGTVTALDEIQYYNTNLSAAQRAEYYAAGVGKYGAVTGLTPQGGWHLDENTGTSCVDFTGNGHTGTIAGTYTWVTGKVFVSGSWALCNGLQISNPTGSGADIRVTLGHSDVSEIYFSSAKYLTTLTNSGILYASATNVLGQVTVPSAISGFVTNASGVPSWVTATGTGAPVLATSPSFVTSVIGGATFAVFNTVSTVITAFGAATTLTIGGTTAATITHNYSTNPTDAGGVTKTVNLGTGGAAGSSTTINIGSAIAGTTTINSPTLSLPTSGVIINFNSSNVILTHSSGILTLGTGTLKITNPTNTATSVVTIDGTQTLSAKTLTSPVINVGSDADGDIYYRLSGALTRLPKGTANHYLRMNAGGTLPVWSAT